MLTARIQGRVPSAKAVTTGYLSGYELCWNKRSRDGSGKCSVIETGHPNHVVWGVVLEMNGDDKSNLDLIEGLGQGYEERGVKVITQIGNVAATIYYAARIEPDLRPYDWYRDLVIDGAREHRLPADYIRTLEAVVVTSDSDSHRVEKNRRLLTARPSK